MSQEWQYYDFMNLNSALSQRLHKEGFLNSIHYLKDIASVKVGMFRYNGIEKIPNLTSEIFETIVLFNNFLCFYDVPGLGVTLCRYVSNNVFNEYIRPVTVNLIALNGTTLATDVPYEDIVLVRDNSLDIIPFIPMVEYIRKIEQCDIAVFRALTVSTLPLVLVGNKKLATQLNTIAKKIGSPDAFIAGSDEILDNVKAFDIDVKINPLDIYELKTKYKNECVASIGIYTVEQKKERKIVNEVNSQNEYTDSIYEDCRNQRIATFEKLKEKYGINIEVIETKRVIAEQHIQDTIDMMSQEGGNGNDNSQES